MKQRKDSLGNPRASARGGVKLSAPDEGWSHEKLMALRTPVMPDAYFGYDAFLGTQWIGSSEV